jgi:hypothetical protein
MSIDNNAQQSVLTTIIIESLVAHPSNAHEKILNYLEDCGINKSQKELFQSSWAKVYLASQAFGKLNKAIDPFLFSRELIDELSKHDRDCMNLKELCHSFNSICTFSNARKKNKSTNSNSTPINGHAAILSSLKSIIDTGVDLKGSYIESYKHPVPSVSSIQYSGGIHGDGYEGTEQSIIYQRRSAKMTKHANSGGLGNLKSIKPSSHYTPIDMKTFYGNPEISYGVAEMKLDSKFINSRECCPLKEDNPTIIVKVSSKQPIYQARGWAAYQFCYEKVTMKYLNLFPLPIGVGRSKDNMVVSFIYDYPSCKSLKPLFGPALATYLKRFPNIIFAWCAQLGLAYDSLIKNSSISTQQLTRVPSINDVYIKEDGLMVIGNLLVTSVNKSSKVSLFSSEKDARKNIIFDDFSTFIYDLLTYSLCLSRRYKAILRNDNDDENLIQEVVINIVEGCFLDITFQCERYFQLIKLKSKDDISNDEKNNLIIDTNVNKDILKLTLRTEENSKSVKVIGIQPGNSLIKCYIPKNNINRLLDDEDSNNDSKLYYCCYIRVVVIPSQLIPSVELQELTSLLENSTNVNRPLFFQARCMQNYSSNDNGNENNNNKNNNETLLDNYDLSHDWNKVVQSVVNLNLTASIKSF